MHISGGNHHLIQFFTQAYNGSVKVFQIFHAGSNSLGQHKHIIGQGLNLKEIVEGCNAFEFILTFTIRHSLEQFAGFTGRTNDEAFTQTHQFRFGNTGYTLKVLQIRIRDQMIQVSQTLLILCEEDNVASMTIINSVLRAQGSHGRINGIEGMNVVLFLQDLHQTGHNKSTSNRIVSGSVMAKLRQTQSICHHIQLEFSQMGQQILGKNQGVDRSKRIRNILTLTLGTNESGIKLRIVGDQHMIADKFNELRQHLLNAGRILQHIVRNTRQFNDFTIQLSSGIDKGLETVDLFSFFHQNSADLDDPIRFGGKSGGFQIKCHKGLIKGHVGIAMYDDAIIHIVDIVGLTTVNDFDIFLCAGNLRLGSSLHCIREGLNAAVIRNSNGPMSPGGSLLDGRTHIGQRIHGAHGGMQVQLYPLLTGGFILPLGHGARHNGKGFQHSFVIKLIHHQFALHSQNRANFYILQNSLGFAIFHKAIDSDRTTMVRHVKINHPRISLLQFFMFYGENPTFHRHRTHIQRQFVHGCGSVLKRLSVNRRCILRLLLLRNDRGCHRHSFQGFSTQLVHRCKQICALQGISCFKLNGDRSGKTLH